MSDDLELLHSPVPGARSAALTPALRAYESHNVTYFSPESPVFWESASGATVVDADGNRYIDLTAAFGVANAGHANPRVVAAVADQAARLMHGMGDVHPTEVRAALLQRLARILPRGLTKTFLATSGSEAVEAALKTAALATGRAHFAAYRGAYHGLSLGALGVGGIEKFRAPFAAMLGGETLLLDFPRASAGTTAEAALETARGALAARDDLAAVIVEPIQGRAGCIVPPHGYLRGLRRLCDELRLLLIFDEIYTGFGRTGTWFAAGDEDVVPDIICIGKGFGNGFPISAAAARPEVMDAWPVSRGEALHTSTYLGNPMGCAAALATIDEHERSQLASRAHALGLTLAARFETLRAHDAVSDIRGRGLCWGIQLRDAAIADAVVKRALRRGVIALQAGARGDTLAISPPLVIAERQLARAIDILEAAIAGAE